MFQLLPAPYHIINFMWNKLYLLCYYCCIAGFSFHVSLYQSQRLLKSHKFSLNINLRSAISSDKLDAKQCSTEEHDKVVQNNSVYLAAFGPRQKQMKS